MIILPSSGIQYTLDLSEMITEVANTLRNEDIPTDITRWINLAILEIASVYVFPEYHAEATLTTSNGNRDYGLNGDLLWLTALVNPSENQIMRPIDEGRLAWIDPKYKTTTGRVTHYTLNGIAISLYRTPTTELVLPYSYQRRPLKLVGTTDVCDLPAQWHPLITLIAAKRGLRREGRFDEIAEISGEINQMRRSLEKNLYKRPDVNVVLEGPETLIGSSGRAWPMLDPNHYPRNW